MARRKTTPAPSTVPTAHPGESLPGGWSSSPAQLVAGAFYRLRAEPVKMRHIGSNPDLAGAARLIQEALCMLKGVDELPEGMRDTPERFVRYLQEFHQPSDPKLILGELFEGSAQGSIHGMVVQHNIPFRMICEHHLLPAFGKAAVGYIPNGKVAGLSKLTRLVQKMGTAKPTLQELVCEEIADALDNTTKARGTIVVISGEHTCMACRGVNAPHVKTTTSTVRGVFRDVPAAREEFFNIIRESR
jgi:GTP cyclohydrolase I